MNFDITSEFTAIDVHKADSSGTTVFTVHGDGLDPSAGRGSYICQFSSLYNFNIQHVDASSPDSTTQVQCKTPHWDSAAATTRVDLLHEDVHGKRTTFFGDDSNRLFDFEASYYDVNVHRGDAAGTTEFAVTGYGLDVGVGRGDYLCQWKMLTGDLHEQSVDAETPDTSTSVPCGARWVLGVGN